MKIIKLHENVQGQGKYSDKLYGYLNFLQDSNKNDNIAYLASQLIRYCKEEDLQDLWIDRMESVAKSVGFGTDDTLDESITDAKTIEFGAAAGMASTINFLIKDEYEAIESYNSAIVTAKEEGFEDAARVLSEIQAEENIHVGQLQEVMKLFDPNADKIDAGRAEGEEQLSNSGIVEESIQGNTLADNVENAYQKDELDLFVADALGDGSTTEKDLMLIAIKSSIIDEDDMKRAIASAK